MLKLHGVGRDYAWGSVEAIPQLVGASPNGAPLAELWFGAHPGGPAAVRPAEADGAGSATTMPDLRAVIQADPAGTLGADVVSRFGARLPYLLKLIAPERPLSLQVHPSLDRARERYAAEEATGIARDAPERNYRDPNHKPELVYALTTFEAMCGFRAPRRAAELLVGLEVPLAQRLRDLLRADPSAGGVRDAFTTLLDHGTRPAREEVAAVAEACAARLGDGSPSPRADGTVVMLAEAYPGDPGVVASLLLNPVTLRPGEALFVPAGGVHAYLSGLGVEIMASSDNVLRAGLTEKHIDVPEMLECVDYVAAPPIRPAPEIFHGATKVFYAPVDDFELSVTDLADPPAGPPHPLPGRGPRILLCLEGAVDIFSTAERATLERGQALFVRADEGRVSVRGQGTVVQADVP
ncbi:mannose-6-phosphate isomerase, class I [Georgenia ruanii]|uniref:mannose-6-phosphate isomerase n=1 Tax=Georgenia ruanii TaxID=348442 RepID=A0A7J9USS8_9MICO|nr:mannose-6-phosphate isomerase, class I [Georgenia ruanii]MPV87671.1 mannose-6-phosphate isomerase, class I [Georgenia ruanii]